jgi:hypothetical protein
MNRGVDGASSIGREVAQSATITAVQVVLSGDHLHRPGRSQRGPSRPTGSVWHRKSRQLDSQDESTPERAVEPEGRRG